MQYNKRSARIKILLQNTKKQTSSTCCQTDISLKNVATKDNTSTTSIFYFGDGHLNALHNGVKVYKWIFIICINIFGLFCSELTERLVIPFLFYQCIFPFIICSLKPQRLLSVFNLYTIYQLSKPQRWLSSVCQDSADWIWCVKFLMVVICNCYLRGL